MDAPICPRCGVPYPARRKLGKVAISVMVLATSGVWWLVSSGPDGSVNPVNDVSSTAATAVVPEPADPDALNGSVLPFRVLNAIRNFGYQRNMVEADISVSVDGGGPADWAATAAYIAELAVPKWGTFAQVEVFVDSPWGDRPPQEFKRLAVANYGPQPGLSPWDEPWRIITADRASLPYEVEYDELASELSDKYSSLMTDQLKAGDRADAEARRMVVRKYQLPTKWVPPAFGGTAGPGFTRSHLVIANTEDASASMPALDECMSRDDPGPIFRGCVYSADVYPLALDAYR